MKPLKIRKIGNSLGVVLPKGMLQELGLSEGDEITARIVDGKLVLEVTDEEHARQMKIARRGMARYRNALAELAK